MDEPLDPATVLEDAADLLLIRGRCRDALLSPDGSTCVMGAVIQPWDPRRWFSSGVPEAFEALESHTWAAYGCDPVEWNRRTEDDFQVIDGLKRVAKNLRAVAVPT